MKAFRLYLIVVLTALVFSFLGNTVTSAVNIRQEEVQFEKGASDTTIAGKIVGYQIVDYQLRASRGQTLGVNFRPSNLSAHFNILSYTSEVAMFVGSISGNSFEGEIPADGVYSIRIYLMGNAARRSETVNYTLEIGTVAAETLPAVGVSGVSFDTLLEMQGIQFRVTSTNEGSVNTLNIVPKGLHIDNSPLVLTIDGTVTGAEVADLNVDGSPEIYIYVTSAGSGSYGSLVAYSANRRKSLSEIYLPPLAEDKVAAKGYMGHDEFAVVETVLVRRFPVYRAADTNAQPTGGMRQLQYKLFPGEAGWGLRVDRIVDY